MRYTVHITDKCNLKCFYCYEDTKTGHVESIEEIDKRFQWIKEKGDCDSVELIGGETFLCADIVEHILNNYSDQYTFVISTNGTIRNKKIDELIATFKPELGVSLDDPLTCARFRRGLNFDVVLQNAKDWSKVTSMCIDCVIHPYNLARIKETFDFYTQEHGFSCIHFGVVEEWMHDLHWDKYVKEVKRLIDSTPVEVLKRVA